MRNYVGLDVSLKSTAVCILNENGKRLLEGEVDTHPEAIHEFLLKSGLEIERIGLESGNLTHFLKKGLLGKKIPSNSHGIAKNGCNSSDHHQ